MSRCRSVRTVRAGDGRVARIRCGLEVAPAHHRHAKHVTFTDNGFATVARWEEGCPVLFDGLPGELLHAPTRTEARTEVEADLAAEDHLESKFGTPASSPEIEAKLKQIEERALAALRAGPKRKLLENPDITPIATIAKIANRGIAVLIATLKEPRYWYAFERNGGVMPKMGPFATQTEARNKGALILEVEPIDVRARCRAVVYEERVCECYCEVEEYVYVDHAPPEARNRKFGFAWRSLRKEQGT